jgi:putative membrane protein
MVRSVWQHGSVNWPSGWSWRTATLISWPRVLLLTVQLAAGGGVLPIELSGGLFRAVHEWLLFTWAVRAMRASLFGAFDGDWLRATTVVAAVGGAALLVSAFVGRWKPVSGAEQHPPIDV